MLTHLFDSLTQIERQNLRKRPEAQRRILFLDQCKVHARVALIKSITRSNRFRQNDY
jgi:hypothetical protein